MLHVAESGATTPAASWFSGARLWRLANAGGLLILIIALIAGIGIFIPSFLSPFNLFALTRNLAVDIIIGFSMMTVLGLGHMNLAVGAIGACAAMVTGFALERVGLPIPLAIIVALLTGMVLGAINGILIVRTGLHSFVITLATASLYFGLMFILTKAEAFRNLPVDFSGLAKGRIGSFSNFLFVALALAIGLVALFNYSQLGRQMLATGANSVAAGLSGVPVNRIVVITHALSGLLAAIAGVLVTARLASALPSIGEDWLLPSFLAPLLGGTLLAGGYVSVVGAVLGAILLSVLQNGLILMNVSGFWIQFFLGLALLAAVGIDRWRSVTAERRGMVSR
ncbi:MULTISPECIES: ABC transporter permease [Chelativorans]|uniref:Autoinducer 2 import system permease protein LsrD n=1 Tax=Chelativorans sp. (strain BNC1) TaxID=266779 RepID=Q11HX4_CHESB|nr:MULTISPECIES: ABC transporter permease [Chelativorans]